jgi:hypothetical protein
VDRSSASAHAAGSTAIEELAEQIEQAKSQPDGCIFGTLDYFPSRPA